jgi:CDP-4-dehydro-6-deoxyglucose reductase, E3
MSQPLRARLDRRSPIADGVVDLVLTMVSPPSMPFRAGQFVTLKVGNDAAGRDVRRSYSLASRSDQGEALRFIVRIVAGGPASDFWTGLPLGSELDLTGPHGFFVLDEHHLGDVVFAATGTGLAPVLPMLGELEKRGEPGRRLVFWGVRHQRDLFLQDELAAACAAANATLHLYLSQPDPDWQGGRGRITGAVLEALPELASPTFYVVGNGAMIDELKKGLVARGVDRKRQIRTEAFFD